MKENEMRLEGLAPLLPEKPEVLILGSMPSVQSLEKGEYYGNPRNHFWPILFSLYHEKPVSTYKEKQDFLNRWGIALWDTIGSCIRTGSLDANIKEAIPNDIAGLLKDYPSIRLIACNGAKSYDMLRKYEKEQPLREGIEIRKLPSSSPIPGRNIKNLEEKTLSWKKILL